MITNFDHLAYVWVSWPNGQKYLTTTMAKISKKSGQIIQFLPLTNSRLSWSWSIFSRILPFGPEGPKWQDCFDTFCARAQKVQNKGWRSTA